ncbi:MAG: hypothetical protein JNL75_11780 [Chitinophagales bacterium]|nr:hypothetical protein [Chitinophagales bacterium]
MKYIFLIIILLCIQTSCKKASTYSTVCNDEARKKTSGVSGREVGATKVKRNSYRTTTRRPHRLGLLRR